MKKYITFANFMVLLGIMTILFYLIPAVSIKAADMDIYSTNVNLFIATFGGSFSISFSETVTNSYSLVACGGLIVAFFLGIVGIVLTFLKRKIKIANLFAFPFYLTAGILVACTVPLINSVNSGTISFFLSYSLAGGAITVMTFWFILAFFALIDFIASIAKPKQQNPAY